MMVVSGAESGEAGGEPVSTALSLGTLVVKPPRSNMCACVEVEGESKCNLPVIMTHTHVQDAGMQPSHG